jgi:hypothetical protein
MFACHVTDDFFRLRIDHMIHIGCADLVHALTRDQSTGSQVLFHKGRRRAHAEPRPPLVSKCSALLYPATPDGITVPLRIMVACRTSTHLQRVRLGDC